MISFDSLKKILECSYVYRLTTFCVFALVALGSREREVSETRWSILKSPALPRAPPSQRWRAIFMPQRSNNIQIRVFACIQACWSVYTFLAALEGQFKVRFMQQYRVNPLATKIQTTSTHPNLLVSAFGVRRTDWHSQSRDRASRGRPSFIAYLCRFELTVV